MKTAVGVNLIWAPSLPSSCCALEHRVDGLNRNSGTPENAFSGHLIRDGLILWRLSTRGHSDLWCMVFELPNGFYFVVDDNPEGPQPSKLCEHHAHIVNVIDRAETLRSSLIESGWVDVDVE